MLIAKTLSETFAEFDSATIVIVALCIVGAVVALVLRYLHVRTKHGGVSQTREFAAGAATGSHIPPHLVAILTAAAVVAVGGRLVVRRITFINRDTVSGWAAAGRTSIQLSHNLRRTN